MQCIFFARFVNEYLFTSTNKQLPQSLKDHLIEMISLEEARHVGHPDYYWKQMTGDINYIFDVMAVSEGGGEWKKYIKKMKKQNRINLLTVLTRIIQKNS